MTIQANIPDFLIRQATDVAQREGTSADAIIAIALSIAGHRMAGARQRGAARPEWPALRSR